MRDETCKHNTQTGMLSQVRCKRAAVKDGYCTRHHPSYVSPQTKAALIEFDAKEPLSKASQRDTQSTRKVTMNLTSKHDKWIASLSKVLGEMPSDIEIIVGSDTIDVLPAGFIEKELHCADMMNGGARLIENASLRSVPFDARRIRPNSESI